MRYFKFKGKIMSNSKLGDFTGEAVWRNPEAKWDYDFTGEVTRPLDYLGTPQEEAADTITALGEIPVTKIDGPHLESAKGSEESTIVSRGARIKMVLSKIFRRHGGQPAIGSKNEILDEMFPIHTSITKESTVEDKAPTSVSQPARHESTNPIQPISEHLAIAEQGAVTFFRGKQARWEEVNQKRQEAIAADKRHEEMVKAVAKKPNDYFDTAERVLEGLKGRLAEGDERDGELNASRKKQPVNISKQPLDHTNVASFVQGMEEAARKADNLTTHHEMETSVVSGLGSLVVGSSLGDVDHFFANLAPGLNRDLAMKFAVRAVVPDLYPKFIEKLQSPSLS